MGGGISYQAHETQGEFFQSTPYHFPRDISPFPPLNVQSISEKDLQGFRPSAAHILLAYYFSLLAEYVWWTDRNLVNLFWNGLYSKSYSVAL